MLKILLIFGFLLIVTKISLLLITKLHLFFDAL